MNEIIRSIEAKQIRSDLPQFNVGDTVRVWVKVVEGNRERLQAFEGTVIAKRNGGIRETFTVRRMSYGIRQTGRSWSSRRSRKYCRAGVRVLADRRW